MLYAKIVFGLPLDGPFDYIVPEGFNKNIQAGKRVWVYFGRKKRLGFVVDLKKKSSIKNLKEVSAIIDQCPVLDADMLKLTEEISEYYCCSWGMVIEAALPQELRNGRGIELQLDNVAPKDNTEAGPGNLIVKAIKSESRLEVYVDQIRHTLGLRRSVLFLIPEQQDIPNFKSILENRLGCQVNTLSRYDKGHLDEWLDVKTGKANIVVGSRSAVFAPLKNLGMIILEREDDSLYKQEQVPHYHARTVAMARCRIEKAKLILGSNCLSLDSYYAVKRNHASLIEPSEERVYPEIKIINRRGEYRFNKKIISKYLQDSIYQALNENDKTIIFLNRKGFATSSYCLSCGESLKCPRCNINLIFYQKDNALSCRYCNFKMELPKICPGCNSGYIKFSGAGSDKIENELSRIFPQAKIERIGSESYDNNDARIFISTSYIIRQMQHMKTRVNFGLAGVLGIDNSLNHIDFAAAEKTFLMLCGLWQLTDKKMVIETQLPNHLCFKSLLNKDPNLFYEEELKQREQLGFPPFRHMILVKLRGKNDDKVREAGKNLFSRMSGLNKRGLKLISVNRGFPAKLREKFYWQILLTSNDPVKASPALKLKLRNFSHSGVIVTVDVDPN